jgi:2-hydroxy-3-oxopropionate reductase
MSVAAIHTVAFLGLGKMGLPMCRHVAAAGFRVQAWNRSPREVAVPPDSHLSMVDSPADAARGADVVITMLPDIAQVQQVCAGKQGVTAASSLGTVLVVMGTVSPVALRAWAQTVAPSGLHVVDAPVSGGDIGAVEGTLSVMVGGDGEDVERVRPVLAAMGSQVRHFGPLGAGQLAKACNQLVVATTLTALAEAVTLGRHSGLDVGELLDALAGGLAGSRAIEVKRELLVSGKYRPGGSAAFQHKDLGFALEAARNSGVSLPVTALVDQLFGSLEWNGHGEEDHSAVVRVIEALAGGD